MIFIHDNNPKLWAWPTKGCLADNMNALQWPVQFQTWILNTSLTKKSGNVIPQKWATFPMDVTFYILKTCTFFPVLYYIYAIEVPHKLYEWPFKTSKPLKGATVCWGIGTSWTANAAAAKFEVGAGETINEALRNYPVIKNWMTYVEGRKTHSLVLHQLLLVVDVLSDKAQK